MEAAGTCEITRLPEELLSAALALTTPRDACSAAVVSRDLRAAADSDAVWSRFVPHDLPSLADGEFCDPAPASAKGRFLRLSDSHRPLLLADGLMSMWLDRETGAKCYMLSARSLHISWGDTPEYWRWIPLPDSCRVSEGAELRFVCWLEIRGRIHSKMLSQDTTYAAYIVFRLGDKTYGLDYPAQEASITVAESTSTRKVCLQSSVNEDEDWAGFGDPLSRRYHRACCGHLVFPGKRSDGWMELKLGELYVKDCDTGEVCMNLMETKVCGPKGGLLVQGIEIRPKKGLLASSSAMSKSKHQAGGEEQAATTTSTVACEIVRLPQELLMKVLSHITPQDAARAAAVSQAFRAILDSDAFWTRFVTSVHNLLLFHYNGQTLSQKEMFLCLSDRPILSVTRRMSMWLDRQTGAKCYMLSARALNIAWSRKPQHWRWIIHCTDRSFSQAAELLSVCWFEIRGKIDSEMLSLNSTYAAFLVFKLDDESAHRRDFPVLKASVSIGGCKSTRQVSLHGSDGDEDGLPSHPQQRADGWMELELGEFYNKQGNDGEVCIRLSETAELNNKKGLIVYGMEIRPKK
ncbi:hypothetical protein PAHAL_1G441500 [Panicum hallii]|uniref:F-box domain-containing protein n=2 Tax=Panicum hallii TaxID=206008 RepID=A0A2S3GUE3_9POAL|nr:F-box protein PP2-B1-like isoform X1 [Panicum hallii]PAN08870.1 hypothetical protein PAHAL_1G441500 [Panicum hallii]